MAGEDPAIAKIRATADAVHAAHALDTTADALAKCLIADGLRVLVVPEARAENLFRRFLADKKAFAFLFQLAMAHLRAFHVYDAAYADVDVVIFERCALEDAVFFLTNVEVGNIGLHSHPDFMGAYEDVTRAACEACMTGTDVFVVVHAPYETTVDRMFGRNRDGERDAYTDDPYFKVLYDNYERFVANLKEVAPGSVVPIDNSAESPLLRSASAIGA